MAKDKRMALLKSTVRVVSKCGMADVSTRSISRDAGVNDAYIYHFFRDKEDMLMQAYLLEYGRFMDGFSRQVELLIEKTDELSFEERFKEDVHMAWRYLIDCPDVCRFFAYYYHSPSFKKYAYEDHHKQVDRIAKHIVHLFYSLEDTENCLYALFTLLYSFALQVVDGELPDSDETWERVAKLLYGTICTHIQRPMEMVQGDEMNSHTAPFNDGRYRE